MRKLVVLICFSLLVISCGTDQSKEPNINNKEISKKGGNPSNKMVVFYFWGKAVEITENSTKIDTTYAHTREAKAFSPKSFDPDIELKTAENKFYTSLYGMNAERAKEIRDAYNNSNPTVCDTLTPIFAEIHENGKIQYFQWTGVGATCYKESAHDFISTFQKIAMGDYIP